MARSTMATTHSPFDIAVKRGYLLISSKESSCESRWQQHCQAASIPRVQIRKVGDTAICECFFPQPLTPAASLEIQRLALSNVLEVECWNWYCRTHPVPYVARGVRLQTFARTVARCTRHEQDTQECAV